MEAMSAFLITNYKGAAVGSLLCSVSVGCQYCSNYEVE